MTLPGMHTVDVSEPDARQAAKVADLQRQVDELQRRVSKRMIPVLTGAKSIISAGANWVDVQVTNTGAVFEYGDGNWNTSTSRWVCPRSGVYRVSMWIEHQNANTNSGGKAFYKVDGGVVPVVRVYSTVSAGYPAAGGYRDAAISATQQVDFWVQNGDNTIRDLLVRFAIERIEF